MLQCCLHKSVLGVHMEEVASLNRQKHIISKVSSKMSSSRRMAAAPSRQSDANGSTTLTMLLGRTGTSTSGLGSVHAKSQRCRPQQQQCYIFRCSCCRTICTRQCFGDREASASSQKKSARLIVGGIPCQVYSTRAVQSGLCSDSVRDGV